MRSISKFGISEFGIPNSESQNIIKIKELKPNKKNKKRRKKAKLMFKLTFNAINVIFILIIWLD